MDYLIQQFRQKKTDKEEHSCCSLWMHQAQKFKTSGLIDIFSSLLTVMAMFIIQENLLENNKIPVIKQKHESQQFKNYSSTIELIFLLSMLEASIMIFVSFITYIGHAKKILFGRCLFICSSKKNPTRRDMEFINLLTIVFLSVLFKISLIYPSANLLDYIIPTEETLTTLNPKDALYIGEMITRIQGNNEIIHILLIIHSLYLIFYLAYLIYEAVDQKRRFSNFIARKLCCCCCLPVEDVFEAREKTTKKKTTIIHELKEFMYM